MKKRLLILLLIVPCIAIAQRKKHFNVEYSRDTIFYKEHIITPGDTLLLGLGSKANNEFQYIFLIDMDNLASGPQILPEKYKSAFLVYKGLQERTTMGKTYPDFQFYFNNKQTKQAFTVLSRALEMNELSLPPLKYVSKRKRRR
jgi:hypothetical protein